MHYSTTKSSKTMISVQCKYRELQERGVRGGGDYALHHHDYAFTNLQTA